MVESFDNYQLDFHFLFQSEEMYFIKCFINRRRVMQQRLSKKMIIICENIGMLVFM